MALYELMIDRKDGTPPVRAKRYRSLAMADYLATRLTEKSEDGAVWFVTSKGKPVTWQG
jgi:hypothetical protein